MRRIRTLIVVVAAMAAIVTASANEPPTEHLLFVGTYTGSKSQGIYAFRFDDRSGALTPLGLAATTPNPSFLTASADGRFLYAVNELDTYAGRPTGSVTAFSVDASRGRLTAIDVQPSEGTGPCHLMLDRTGRFLAVANYNAGTFAIFPVLETGALGPALKVLTDHGTGPNPTRQEGPHAHEAVFDPSNRFLLTDDLGIDRVLVYRFDAATGAVVANDPPGVSVAPGAGPRHLVFHPNGSLVFGINELASTITSYRWEAPSGRLTVLRTASTLPPAFHGTTTAAEIAIHPNGRFLYGSNRGHDSIAAFAIGPNGDLTLIGFTPTRGKTPRQFAIDPSGRWLLVGNQDSNTIATFRIDPETGALTRAGALTKAGSPVCILFVS